MDTYTVEIPLDQINEPANAMRTDIDRDAVFELAQDIKKNGLINPITVRPDKCEHFNDECPDVIKNPEIINCPHGRYEVVAGHRRFLAHRYGGIPLIKCIVRELSDDETYSIMTSENLARQDVNPVDEAVHVGRLMKMHNDDIAKVGELTSRSRGWVEDRLLINNMQEDIKQLLRQEKIKLGVALALSQITNDVDRAMCISTAETQGISVPIAQYYLAQWKAGLFGSQAGGGVPDSELPPGEIKEVRLRCAVDGKDYPATDFVSFLVYRDNANYIYSLREHLQTVTPQPEFSGGGNPNTAPAGAVAPAASMN